MLPISSLHVVPNTIHPHVIAECAKLFFRQSFLGDYLTCPQLALYRWILGMEEERTTFAALLGSAGHEVIYWLHKLRGEKPSRLQIMEHFETSFWKIVKDENRTPKLGVNYASVEEQLRDNTPWYTDLLVNYQGHKKNQSFHSTMHEQSFVLVVGDPAKISSGNPPLSDLAAAAAAAFSVEDSSSPFIFSGQLDQGGYYDEGFLSLRDIKFRDNHFRPTRARLDLDIQMTIYAAAMKYGVPACKACKPRYDDDGLVKTLVYNGPCDACKALIKTPRWPQKFPEKCELIWMFDFEAYKKDQYEKECIDNTAAKIPNPKGKGPMVFPRKINPKWAEGYKEGDLKGACFIPTYRTPAQIDALMGDILKVCSSIRQGIFFRRPNEHCNMCSFAEPCRKSLEVQVQEANFALMQQHASDDPF